MIYRKSRFCVPLLFVPVPMQPSNLRRQTDDLGPRALSLCALRVSHCFDVTRGANSAGGEIRRLFAAYSLREAAVPLILHHINDTVFAAHIMTVTGGLASSLLQACFMHLYASNRSVGSCTVCLRTFPRVMSALMCSQWERGLV